MLCLIKKNKKIKNSTIYNFFYNYNDIDTLPYVICYLKVKKINNYVRKLHLLMIKIKTYTMN